MDDDVASTATMTSVTEEWSQDEFDVTGNELETSSQVTTSDTNEEGITTVVHTPLSQQQHEQLKVDNVDVNMDEDDETDKEEITTTATTTATTSEHDSNSRAQTDQNPRQKSTAGHSGSKKCSAKGSPFLNMLSTPDNWYEHHCFDRYWRHYQFVSVWCQKHLEVYRAVVRQYNATTPRQPAAKQAQKPNSQSDVHVFKKPLSSRTIRNRKARRRRKAAKKRMRMSLKNAELAGSCSSLSHSLDEGEKSAAEKEEMAAEPSVEGTDLEEEMQIEISEEMLDFFAHTHKHRQERDALKKSKRTEKEEKLVNIEEVRGDQKERTAAAPTERPGSKRTSEMRQLYGKGAAMIHGMETALQMNFDRNLDVQQPNLWPNMPFRLIFD